MIHAVSAAIDLSMRPKPRSKADKPLVNHFVFNGCQRNEYPFIERGGYETPGMQIVKLRLREMELKLNRVLDEKWCNCFIYLNEQLQWQ